MRGKNLIKLLKTLDLLSKPEGATIGELGENLGVDKRSVYRMIELVEELGVPVYDEKVVLEKEKRWKIEDSYLKKLPNITLPDVRLSLSEVWSLYLLKGEGAVFRGTEIEKYVESAFKKLGLFISEDTYSSLNGIKALFLPTSKFAKDYSGKEEILQVLTQAMLQRNTCTVRYHSFHDDRVKGFDIDPLHFFEQNGGLYLLVRTTAYGDTRTLAVERIEEVTVTSATFAYPADFDPQALLEKAFDVVYDDPIDVMIWFAADVARFIKERTWSKTQKIEDQPDGSIILSMSTSGSWDVIRWVLSYGSEARLLEPEALRKEVKEELAGALDGY